jgi:uncharacterized protein
MLAVKRLGSAWRMATGGSVSFRSFSTRASFQDAVEEVNSNEHSKVRIQETPDGRGYGLFARRSIAPGELVFRGKALQTSSQRCTHSIQVDWDKHVTMDVPAILVNHSCDANLGIQENDQGAFDFYSLQPIPIHAELLWDYETAESQISNFSCACGAPDCRGELRGFVSSNGEKVLAKYGADFVAPYLFRKL